MRERKYLQKYELQTEAAERAAEKERGSWGVPHAAPSDATTGTYPEWVV